MIYIKNAVVIKTELPAMAELAEKMEGLRFNGLLDTEFYGYGFIDSSGDGLITKLNNGFMFTLRYEERLLPTDAVNKALEERLDQLEELRGERPTAKKEIQSIRDGVIGEMAKIAFIRPKVVGCFYDETNKMLILNTDSAKLVRKVTTALLKVLGKLETKTIHLWDLKHGLTTRLREYIKTGEGFSGLTLGDEIRLKLERGDLMTLKDIDPTDSEQLKAVVEKGEGFEVKHIRFDAGAFSVRVDSGFKLKSINWDLDKVTADESENITDSHDVMVHEANVMMVFLVAFIQKMIALFDTEVNQ